MENEKPAKTKKKLKLSAQQKQNTAIIFVVLLIAVYIAVELYGAFNVSLQTQTALVSTVYETIDAKALVVREEHVVPGKVGAVTLASVCDCEKVMLGGGIA